MRRNAKQERNVKNEKRVSERFRRNCQKRIAGSKQSFQSVRQRQMCIRDREEFEELKERFDQTEEILKNVWLLTKQNATKETFKAVLEDANAITIQLVAEAVQTAAMFQKFEQFNGKRV